MADLAQEYISFARQLATTGSYSKAFDFYMTAFEKSPDLMLIYESEFRTVMNQLSEVLNSAHKMEDIFCNFSRALKSFPNNMYILNDTGKYLFKYGFYEEAWNHFQRAMDMDSRFVNAEKNFNSLKNLLVERWHFRMLNDKIRNEAYRAAIHQTLIPIKDSVLDLGTGTGLLAMYANECDPMAITACDGNKVMTKLANAITLENGSDHIIIVNKMSTSMNYRDIGGKRSLLLTEMFDAGLFGEHVLQSLVHAWECLLNRAGRVIPNKAEFFIIGAKSDFLNERYQLCSSIKSLLDIQTLNVHVLTYDETYDCEDVHCFGDDLKYMTEPTSLMKINFNDYQELQETINRTQPYEIKLKVLENGEINTIIGYFNLYLTDTVTVTTDPRSDKRADAWQQAVFFDSIPKQVLKNDFYNLEFLINGGKLTLLPKCKTPITRISPETLRFLNDTEYIKMISGCIGMASVYLGQMAEMSQVNIIDLSPFPMFGLQLMKRGAKSLICCCKTDSDQEFFKKVFEVNGVPLNRVRVLVGDDWSKDGFKDEKYHAIFCNMFELCGEIDLRLKKLAQHLKQHHLLRGGLIMPANIKYIGQVIKSNWLDINNRLYDERVSDYKISKHLNQYQVSQNFCIDFSHLEYTPLSEPWVVGTNKSPTGTALVNVPIIKEGHPSAILCWYTIELMEDLTEISTNRKNCFIDGIVFLIEPTVCLKQGEITHIMRCVDPDGAFKLMLHVEAT